MPKPKPNRVTKPTKSTNPPLPPTPRRPTTLLSHLTPEQHSATITSRLSGAPATGVIPQGYKHPISDLRYDLPEYTWDSLLLEFYRQTQDSYIMEEEIKAESARRNIMGEPPCQKTPEGSVPPTYDPEHDMPDYSFGAILERYKRQKEESFVTEAEIREEQRGRSERAGRWRMARRGEEKEVEAMGEEQTPPASRDGSLS
ncbi:uncharacterized protein QC763_207562 [Podospora pseudopauciseta]|uniref:Uncharacterized protein n=1 Tax=Podospora pseudopauciseta TaxID=2093780 RepID=A0ABR0HPE4_9PEZI|nr:hypothetical protein QC763_207562 [Podospora pseudopauciseta]